MPVIIKPPETENELAQMYRLRWRILRAPWGEPEGSEKDDIENDCFHVIAVDNNKVIACGRLQFNSESEAQIRYMAVEPAYEGQGIGRRIVSALEQHAAAHSRNNIVLDARENAVGFYEKLGYRVTEKSYLLFGSIQHWRMYKPI